VAAAAATNVAMQFEAKLTLDGLMTLIAGVIAFIAVIIQIRSSSKQVQEQIKAQRDAEKAELERRRRAVAAALLSEIDSFYASHLERRNELFEFWKRKDTDPQSVEVFRALTGKPFAVYESLADELGGFDAAIARGIVMTYGLMANFIDLLERYERELGDTSSRGSAAQALRNQVREGMRNSIRKVGELAVQSVVMMCRALCVLSYTDFSTLFVAKESGLGSQDLASKLPWFVPGAGSGNAQKN